MSDGIGLAEVLLGLPGFRVLGVVEDDVELVVTIESIAVRAHCRSCGVRLSRRIGCRWTCAIWRASVGRPGCGGSSGGGAAGSRSVRRGRGPRRPNMSTRKRC